MALGLISSFLGIGGGPINIVVLYYFFSIDAKTAARNSIYIILFSQITSFVTIIITGSIPHIAWQVLGLMVAGGIIGGSVGSAISRKTTTKRVEQIFCALLFVIMGVNVLNIIRFLG